MSAPILCTACQPVVLRSPRAPTSSFITWDDVEPPLVAIAALPSVTAAQLQGTPMRAFFRRRLYWPPQEGDVAGRHSACLWTLTPATRLACTQMPALSFSNCCLLALARFGSPIPTSWRLVVKRWEWYSSRPSPQYYSQNRRTVRLHKRAFVNMALICSCGRRNVLLR